MEVIGNDPHAPPTCEEPNTLSSNQINTSSSPSGDPPRKLNTMKKVSWF
jgi:hypothetical protein